MRLNLACVIRILEMRDVYQAGASIRVVPERPSIRLLHDTQRFLQLVHDRNT